MPDDVREALEDAIVARKLEIHAEHGCSTYELARAERMVARYDKAYAWLNSQRPQDGESPHNLLYPR